MKLCVDAGAAALLETLHRAGHRAYVVGGCVRDGLLGRVPHDWDLCTSATPQQVLELFGAERSHPYRSAAWHGDRKTRRAVL